MSVYFNKKDELKEKAVSHYKMMEDDKNEIYIRTAQHDNLQYRVR